jgi:hypothetical protein
MFTGACSCSFSQFAGSCAVAARQDQHRVGTSNFFGQFFRVIFFLTLHQLNGGDGYNAYYYKGET